MAQELNAHNATEDFLMMAIGLFEEELHLDDTSEALGTTSLHWNKLADKYGYENITDLQADMADQVRRFLENM